LRTFPAVVRARAPRYFAAVNGLGSFHELCHPRLRTHSSGAGCLCRPRLVRPRRHEGRLRHLSTVRAIMRWAWAWAWTWCACKLRDRPRVLYTILAFAHCSEAKPSTRPRKFLHCLTVTSCPATAEERATRSGATLSKSSYTRTASITSCAPTSSATMASRWVVCCCLPPRCARIVCLPSLSDSPSDTAGGRMKCWPMYLARGRHSATVAFGERWLLKAPSCYCISACQGLVGYSVAQYCSRFSASAAAASPHCAVPRRDSASSGTHCRRSGRRPTTATAAITSPLSSRSTSTSIASSTRSPLVCCAGQGEKGHSTSETHPPRGKWR